MAGGPLNLTRDQLALFLKDQRQIRAFENLISSVETTNNIDFEAIVLGAANGLVQARLAIDKLTELRKVVDGNQLAPVSDDPVALELEYLDLDRYAGHAMLPGRIAWNSTDSTVDIGMEYDVTQQVGQETYARVGNTTGVTIPNGTVVGFAGATSDAILVAPYLADGSTSTLYVLGVMTHDLPDSGQTGYCTTWGFVRGMDTSGFTAGDILYPDPAVAGGLTNVKPTAPDNVVPIAACVISDATDGVIFVRPTIEQQRYYGVFSKADDATPAAINTAYALTFTTTEIANGVSIGATTSRIIAANSGLYSFNVTLQLISGSSSAKTIWVWFRKNGTDIANSARIVTCDINNGYVPVAMNEVVSLAANEYIEIMYASDDVNVTFKSVAPTAFAPGAPAVSLTVSQAQQ